MSLDDPLIGQVVSERFRVTSLLGEGGMGKVYRAVQEDLGREVALKLLRERVTRTERNRQRFLREARTASRISHPGLAVIYDFGEWQGQLYLAMELLTGRSLAQMLERQRRIPGERAAGILVQACEVLDVAHEAGILHRDLKPENIMLTVEAGGQERVKVVDFGLAMLLDDDSTLERLTQEGMVAGTPTYMAPEQCRADRKAYDRRTDVYAVGVILYELLCGHLPFYSENAQEVLLQHLYQDPIPPSDRCPKAAIHPALESIALWAMAKAPADRPASMRVLRDELLAALALMTDETAPALARTPGVEASEAETAFRAAPTVQSGVSAALAAPRAQAEIAVVEPASLPVAESLCTALRALGFAARPFQDQHLTDGGGGLKGVRLVVLDLRRDIASLIPMLEARFSGHPSPLPLVAVGPEDAIEAIARLIALGVADYVPEPLLTSRLPKVLSKRLRRPA